MVPTFNFRVVKVTLNPNIQEELEVQVRVNARFLFFSGSSLVTFWLNTRTQKGGVKAQTAI